MFVCSRPYENASLRVAFCDYVELPSMRPLDREWGAEDYIRKVFYIHKSTDQQSTGKTYKGVDLTPAVNKYVKDRTAAICKGRVKDGPRRSAVPAVENTGTQANETATKVKKQ